MTNDALRHIWSQLQKAESDLMGAIRSRPPEIGRLILGDFDLSSYDYMLFFRLVSGFDIHHLSADRYLQRYPFSSVEAIEEASKGALQDLRQRGWLESVEGLDGTVYKLSELGQGAARVNEEVLAGMFISAWPALDSAQFEQLEAFLARLNHELGCIISEDQS